MTREELQKTIRIGDQFTLKDPKLLYTFLGYSPCEFQERNHCGKCKGHIVYKRFEDFIEEESCFTNSHNGREWMDIKEILHTEPDFLKEEEMTL